MRREITGFSNPLLKQVRALREKKHRKRAGLFLAEGLRIMTEAREAGFLPEMLFVTLGRDDHDLISALENDVLTAGGDVISVSAEIMSKLSGKDNAQAIVGIYRDHGVQLTDIDRTSAPIWLVAQAMRDPGNLGTMLRTGDAVGAGGLILIDDCTDPFSVEAVRASMGAVFTQAIVQCRWDEFTAWLRSGDGQLVGTSLQTDTDYQDCRYTAPCFILTGNEAQGLPEAYEAECDALVKMPMYGKADSLNAAIATAVMAYEVRGQMRRG
ncbi:TrmH family RNA methyltransferase [Sphingorhabdus arenilitoris]|uniref:TrmH family RNA methyltransferase n=1 Tax=Sphingorhabdus arenilitoris TaxID=1490041 RepID=A0ABV8RGW2_9SPHN